MSSTRRHSSRVKSRRPEVTPYPRFVELESDQELSLTPTESEDGSVESKESLNVTRKLDFNVEDDDKSVFEQNSQLLEDTLKNPDYSGSSNDSSSNQDMFASQGSDPIHAAFTEPLTENATSCTRDSAEVMEDLAGADELDEVSTEAKKTDSGKMVVMIPESSSESSLGEFSPLLVGQSKVNIHKSLIHSHYFMQGESEDELADMFSDQEDKYRVGFE